MNRAEWIVGPWCQRLLSVMHDQGLAPECAAVDACWLTDGQIKALNAQWLNKDKPTNILSFPSPPLLQTQGHLGSLCLGRGVVRHEAQQLSRTSQNPGQESLLSSSQWDRIHQGAMGLAHNRKTARKPMASMDDWHTAYAAYLMVHGLLHLVGYDHATLPAYKRMQKAEGNVWHGAWPFAL